MAGGWGCRGKHANIYFPPCTYPKLCDSTPQLFQAPMADISCIGLPQKYHLDRGGVEGAGVRGKRERVKLHDSGIAKVPVFSLWEGVRRVGEARGGGGGGEEGVGALPRGG